MFTLSTVPRGIGSAIAARTTSAAKRPRARHPRARRERARDAGGAAQRTLDRGGDRARVEDVAAEVVAVVDARDDDRGLTSQSLSTPRYTQSTGVPDSEYRRGATSVSRSGLCSVIACDAADRWRSGATTMTSANARVLRPGGELLISTPNRITFSPGRDTPLNPFHTRELNAAELTELLVGAGFTVTTMTGVHHSPRLSALDAEHGGSIIDAQLNLALAGTPWPAELSTDVAAITTDDFDLRTDDIDTSLDLVAIATRP